MQIFRVFSEFAARLFSAIFWIFAPKVISSIPDPLKHPDANVVTPPGMFIFLSLAHPPKVNERYPYSV